MTYYGIYRITNLTNGKMYIGQHATSELDDGYMGSGKIIKHAVKKYGKENFRKEWLMFCEDEEELNYMERVYVDQTWVDRSDTYNLRLGGDGGQHSEQTRKKMSESHKGKIAWNKGIKMPQEAHKGNHNPFYGKHHSEKTKRKMSEALKGKNRNLSEEARRKMSEACKGRPAWNRGKHSTEETRKKMSKNKTGRHWYTNGQINVFMYECPDGFYSGMIHFNKKEGSR